MLSKLDQWAVVAFISKNMDLKIIFFQVEYLGAYVHSSIL